MFSDIAVVFRDYYDVIDGEVDNIASLPLDIRQEVVDMQKEMMDYHDEVEKYNNYR